MKGTTSPSHTVSSLSLAGMEGLNPRKLHPGLRVPRGIDAERCQLPVPRLNPRKFSSVKLVLGDNEPMRKVIQSQTGQDLSRGYWRIVTRTSFETDSDEHSDFSWVKGSSLAKKDEKKATSRSALT